MNFFRYNIVVEAYPVFVYVVSRAGRQVDLPPCTRNNVKDMLPQQYYNEKFIFLTRDFS